MAPRSLMKRGIIPAVVVASTVLLGSTPAWAQGVLKTLIETGSRSQRINIAILAEGYTASQQAKFETDAANMLNAVLANPYYADYRNFFNAYSIFVASNQSGADHPATNTFVDTYFNGTFNSYGIDRFLTIPPNDRDETYAAGEGKVFNLLANLLPDYNIALLVVNDSTYGGSGGPVAVASTNSYSADIAIHELGHSVVHLGDEYSDPYPEYPDIEEPNTTTQTDPALIKWRAWFVPGTPIPTPATSQYATLVGLFEGAHYHSTGWYRPQLDCRMRTLTTPFCKVCLEASALTFYDLSPPIDSVSPNVDSIILGGNSSQLFSVTVKQPTTPLSIQWSVDGTPVAGETRSTFSLNASTLSSDRTHTVSVLVRDVSSRIRTDPTKLSQQTHSWIVDFFRITSMQMSNSNCTVTWNSFPGTTYQVQWSNSLTGQWTNASGGLITAGTGQLKTSYTDFGARTAGRRFYRVIKQ